MSAADARDADPRRAPDARGLDDARGTDDAGGTDDVGATLARVHDLAVGYGGPPVLSDVDFEVHPGVRVGVLGPNGGGKTTLFRALLGELAPSRGEIELGSRIAIVAQTERSRLDFPVTALDVATMGTITRVPWYRRPGRAERAAAMDALAAVGMDELAGRSFGDLSGGQRQRVLIARALVQDAKLLLLDEPFTGLDAVSADRLERLLADLASRGHGLLIATHDVEQARAWDLVLCIHRRQIAFGPPEQALTRESLAATYGGAVVTIPATGERVLLPADHHHHDH
ncbi:MAG TPA: metal ABC transporter ATP-binding protein [Thermoleophilaceae bacterium]|nr:metal ABC transporter ATP-binding protein [Thermoleophilaceae bacterium]